MDGSKAMKGVVAYLEKQGYEIIDVDSDDMLIIADDKEHEEMVFISVIAQDHANEFKGNTDHSWYEKHMIDWFAKHPDHTGKIRCDCISIMQIADSKGLIRHELRCSRRETDE